VNRARLSDPCTHAMDNVTDPMSAGDLGYIAWTAGPGTQLVAACVLTATRHHHLDSHAASSCNLSCMRSVTFRAHLGRPPHGQALAAAAAAETAARACGRDGWAGQAGLDQ
jgi:hypothetical protein